VEPEEYYPDDQLGLLVDRKYGPVFDEYRTLENFHWLSGGLDSKVYRDLNES
jgi:hypothetical protein